MEETKNINGKFEIDAILSSDFSSSDKSEMITTENDDLLQSYKEQQTNWNSEVATDTQKQYDISKGFNLDQSF